MEVRRTLSFIKREENMTENTTKPGDVNKMKAVAINRFGGVDEMELQRFPIPQMESDEVLIRVHAAGVGVWDPKEREGVFAKMRGDENPDFPRILGREGAGTVLDVGTEVTNFTEGDKVYINGSPIPAANLYAEYATAKAEHVMPVPNGLSLYQAGTLPVDAITALTGLDEILNLRSGETLLVFGASGGLGHLAVQLAKRMDAKVFAIASGNDGVDLINKLGADATVDGRNEDFAEAAHKFAPDGFDAALLTAGGEAAEQALKTLREGGRAVYPYGVNPEPEAPEGVDLEGYNMNSTPEVYKKLNSLIEDGPFIVHIARSFPLEKAAEAHRQIDEHYIGKYVLEVI